MSTAATSSSHERSPNSLQSGDDRTPARHVGPYLLSRTIGTGSTGKVKLGIHMHDGTRVAVKIIRKDQIDLKPSMRLKVEREIAILKLIDHPQVLRLVDVYENESYLFIVMEFVEGGELFDYLVKKGRLELPEALNFFQQIIMGLDYCHTMLICHRDLKPENLLLDANKSIKIADFGMASLNRRGSMLETSCGSPHYASPQVVMGIKYDGMQADVWSCGVILYALVTGRLPFDDPNIKKLLSKVKVGTFQMPEDIDPRVKDLINRMLTVDPDKRITIDGIKKHVWFMSNGGPVVYVPPFDVQQLSNPVKQDQLDWEVIADLQTLGWGSEEEIVDKVLSSERSLEKIFYHFYERKKKPSKTPAPPPPVQGRFERRSVSMSAASNPLAGSSPSGKSPLRISCDSPARSSPMAIPSNEDYSGRTRNSFKNPIQRLTGKESNYRSNPSSPSNRPSAIIVDALDYDSPMASPMSGTPKSKESYDESPATPPDGPRVNRKKILPEISTSSVANPSPKSSWNSSAGDGTRLSNGNGDSSSPNSSHLPNPVSQRRPSFSKNGGFVVARDYEETIAVLLKSLQELSIDSVVLDPNTVHCRTGIAIVTSPPLVEFRVMISSLVDDSTHVLKFHRLSDNIVLYDKFVDKVQKKIRSYIGGS
eukprot:TRINITY_DN76_c0_g7_i1.p1 TRINITY_DN76_c0_g7~~TRINITY_DN76_c0_g7_i1.p1  ORF type:complete len:650 (-),score=133.19 TRINITY_DN76_c0_g7_i1:1907-3856(-)